MKLFKGSNGEVEAAIKNADSDNLTAFYHTADRAAFSARRRGDNNAADRWQAIAEGASDEIGDRIERGNWNR